MKTNLDKATSFLDSWLSYRIQQVDIPGLSVAVFFKDKVVFSRSYGWADEKQQVLLTPDHLFQVASQTKMLTATAILKLVQAGRLGLDDRVVTYLPWLLKHPDPNFHRITIRQLLAHTAGLTRSNHDNDYWLFTAPFQSKAQLRKDVLTTNLAFKPGHGVKYSNIGYGLLGLVCESVSNQPYARHIRQTILEPLQLPAIHLDYAPALKNRIATGYGMGNQTTRTPLDPRLPLKSLAPAAGMYATPEMMCRFAAAMFLGDNRVLKDKSKKEMQRTQAEVHEGYDAGATFGLGFMGCKMNDRQLFGHDGHVGGHVSSTFFDPVNKLAVAVCANGRDVPANSILRGIFGVLNFFLQEKQAPASPFEVRLANQLAAVHIVQNGPTIAAIDPNDWEPFAWYEELEKINATTLRLITPGSIFNLGELVQFTFERGAVMHVKFAGITMYPES